MPIRAIDAKSFRPLLVRTMVLPILLMFAFAGVLLWQVTRLISTSGWVDHTDLVLAKAYELREMHAELESGVRGFLITQDPNFRSPYDHAIAHIDPAIMELSDLVSDNGPQVARLKEIQDLKNSWVAYVTDEMEKRQDNADWQASVKSGGGKKRMDRIRELFRDLINTEQTLRDKRVKNASATVKTSLWLTGVMALFIGTGLALLSSKQLLILSDTFGKALDEANQSAEVLEQRVNERTVELATANSALHDEITERQKAAAALELANSQLAVSNRELQDFASVASHDLQEPLRKVQAFGDRLKAKAAENLDEHSRDYLERMLNAAARMKTLINDLLTFARVTSRAQPFGRIDLKLVADQVLMDLEARIEDTSATVCVGDLPELEADVTQMRQILQNLIGNALKFTKPGQPPRITVESTLTGQGTREMVHLTVQDNGIGFDIKYTDRIFAVFQRLHGRHEYEGTGIGLAVCRKIAERHGGKIEAFSSPGEGARFEVTIPRWHPELHEDVEPAPAKGAA